MAAKGSRGESRVELNLKRIDISNYLVHFTKGTNALDNFKSIVKQSQLNGGTGFIKGNHRCVCFSESPLHALQDILDRSSDRSFRFAPFGVVVEKSWLFRQDGRPVIYQTKDEGEDLPEELHWRHVTFDLTASPKVDFTWEREWRIQTDLLRISPDNAILVVKGIDELREMCQSHTTAHEVPLDLFEGLEDTTPLSAEIAEQRWTVILIRDPPEGWSGWDVDLD